MEAKRENPIKEIIFSISFTNQLNIEEFKELGSTEIFKDFPAAISGYDDNNSNQNKAGIIYKTTGDVKKILNIRLGKLSFHILDKYVDFESILKDFISYWSILQEKIGKLDISLISVRYINLLPISEDESSNDYLNIKISSPFEKDIKNNLITLKMNPVVNDNSITSHILIGYNSKRNIILDTIVEQKFESTVKTSQLIEFFGEFRNIKNSIFQKAVSEKTRQRFKL